MRIVGVRRLRRRSWRALLRVLYSVRSERMLMEQMRYKPAVSLVRRAGHRRRGVGPFGVLEEPGPAA